MRRLPGSTAFSIISAALLVGAASCGLRTTLDYDPNAPGQTNTGPLVGRLDASAPVAVTNPPVKTDAAPATITPPVVPDAAPPISTTPDAAVIKLDTRPGTPTTPDATVQLPEVGNVPPFTRGDAAVGGRTDVGVNNRDAGAPTTPVTRDGGTTPPRVGADAAPGFNGPDLGTRVPPSRDAGFTFPTTGVDAGFAPPFAIDGGFSFSIPDAAGRTRPDSGRGRGATGQN
jgi:hypothetical protein